MKKSIWAVLILTAGLVFPQLAQANFVTVTWDENMTVGESNAVVKVDRFFLYWGKKGQPLTSKIAIGPPPPASSAVTAGVTAFKPLSMSKPEWLAGDELCFEMTAAWLDNNVLAESAHSGQVCAVVKPLKPNPPGNLKFE